MERNKILTLSTIIPGRLRKARLARGFSMIELAEIVGVTRQAISQFEVGRKKPSGEVFAKIAETLDFPIAFFTNPINRDTSTGVTFFRSLQAATKRSRDMVFERLDWLYDISTYLDQYLAFPEVDVPEIEWEVKPGEEEPDIEAIDVIACEVRKRWGLGLGPISNVLLLLEKHGIIIGKGSFGNSERDGCSRWDKGKPYVFLGSDKDCAVRSRHDAAHELGHLVLHSGIDEAQIIDSKMHKQIEREAHAFAGAFLLPRDSFEKEVIGVSLSHFIRLKSRWMVSIQGMMVRCKEIGLLSDNQYLYLWRQLSAAGYRKREPLDEELVPEVPSLLRQGIKALISNGIKTGTQILDDLKLPQKDIEELCALESGTLSTPPRFSPTLKLIK